MNPQNRNRSSVADLQRIVIIGAGGPVEELVALVQAEPSLEVLGVMDPCTALHGTTMAHVEVLGWLADLPADADGALIGLPAIPHGFDREAIFYLLLQKGLYLPSVAAATACADDVPLRRGCVLLAGATVATDVLMGENCLIGVECCIEPGATVPDHMVVAAGEVVDSECIAKSVSSEEGLSAVVAQETEPLEMIIRRINWANMEIILVVDGGGSLLGTVTDGDIRRGILSGVSLDEPVSIVMNARPITVTERTSREEMLRLMRERSIRHLPVVDAQRHPIRLERMEQLVDDYTGQAVVMAGGMGTRLRPFTDHTPKPLVSVAGRPILDHTLSRLRKSGIENVVISINHLGEQIRRHVGTGKRRDLQVDYVSETQRLGTAGALTLMDPLPDKPFLVMNGDLMTNLDFSKLLKFQKKKEYDMVLCVRQHAIQIPYGVVEVVNGCVQQLREKPNVESFINAGIYVLTPSCIDLIPTGTFFDMTDLVVAIGENGGKVGVFPIIEYWRDIGRPEDLEAAHQEHEALFVGRDDVSASIPMETIG